MQWFLASQAMLAVMLGAGYCAGALIIVLLPPRVQPAARLFLAAPLGWALLTLPATLLGWIGHGFAGWLCPVATASAAILGAWVGRSRLPRWGREFPLLVAFGIMGSLPILAPLLINGAFSEYNDSFIYMTHAQWLQHHGFLGHAHTDGGHPAWGQVIGFRQASLRMGASFLLAWVQAVFHLDWSYEIYPAFSALGLITGALAVGGLVRAACPGARLEAWLSALVVAGTANGFVFGAAEGFLGQTWGLAFAALAIAIRGWEMASATATEQHTDAETRRPAEKVGRPGKQKWWTFKRSRLGIAVGLAVAAAMHCYWDLAPFLGPGLAASYLAPFPGRRGRAWVRALARALPALLVSLALVNLEWVRAVRGIFMNLKMVVANPVAWHIYEFPAHALGLKDSIWDGGQWITEGPWGEMLGGGCAIVLMVMAALGVKGVRGYLCAARGRMAPWPSSSVCRPRVLTPAAVWLLLSGTLFLYFRFVAKSPWSDEPPGYWPDGVGQSWSQYKLMCWDSALLIGAVTAAAIGLSRRFLPRVLRPLLLLTLAIWAGTGLGWNYRLGSYRSRFLCTDAHCASNPFAALLAARQTLAGLPYSEWIYLDWPYEQRMKYRQLVTYFLFDHPLAADWHDDGYIAPFVTPEDAQRNASNCEWVLTYHPDTQKGAANTDTMALGGLTLTPGISRRFSLAKVVSPYGREVGGDGWFCWTDHQIEMDFQLRSIPGMEAPSQVRLRFDYRAATQRVLRVEVTGHLGTVSFPLAASEAMQSATSQPIDFSGGDLRVVITSDEPAKQVNAEDKRALAFLVANVTVVTENRTGRDR